MQLLEAIGAENERILSTVAKLEDSTAGNPDVRQSLLDQLDAMLEEQLEMNERLVYPTLIAAEQGHDLVDRSRQELAELSAATKAVEERTLDDPQVKFELENLSSLIRQHAEHEKQELLPGAERLLSDEEEQRLIGVAVSEFQRLEQRIQA